MARAGGNCGDCVFWGKTLFLAHQPPTHHPATAGRRLVGEQTSTRICCWAQEKTPAQNDCTTLRAGARLSRSQLFLRLIIRATYSIYRQLPTESQPGKITCSTLEILWVNPSLRPATAGRRRTGGLHKVKSEKFLLDPFNIVSYSIPQSFQGWNRPLQSMSNLSPS
jgi:hypothetical protein